MRKKATVDRLLPQNRAELLVRRESACSGDCHKCGGCGGVEQILRLTARDPIGVQRGDIVYVESESSVVLKGAALIYMLPLLLFLAGYLMAMPLGGWAFAIGGAGFVLGWIPAVLYDRHVKKNPPDYVITGFVE